MSRISRATLFDLPIDSLDEMLAKVDAVTVDDLTELARSSRSRAPLSRRVGRDESRFRDALAPVSEAPGARHDPALPSPALPGAWARRSVRPSRAPATPSWRPGPIPRWCRAQRGARRWPTSSSTSPLPRPALGNAEACLDAGVHVVLGTTGFDLDPAAPGRRDLGEANCFVAPNFAIGAVLLMEVAQEIATHMPECEIVELHHDRKLDAPSGRPSGPRS